MIVRGTTSDAQDVANNSMPPGNLTALKAFVEAQRTSRPIFTREEEKEVGVLPEGTRRGVESFIRDFPKIRLFKPDGKPKPEWRLFHGETWREAFDLAHVAALQEIEARKDAPKNVTNSEKAVLAAEKGAAREAAGMAASQAALRMSRYTTHQRWVTVLSTVLSFDVAMMAHLAAIADLDFEGKAALAAQQADRWEVWQKGYGLCFVVDGVFYVYCGKESIRSEEEC